MGSMAIRSKLLQAMLTTDVIQAAHNLVSAHAYVQRSISSTLRGTQPGIRYYNNFDLPLHFDLSEPSLFAVTALVAYNK